MYGNRTLNPRHKDAVKEKLTCGSKTLPNIHIISTKAPWLLEDLGN